MRPPLTLVADQKSTDSHTRTPAILPMAFVACLVLLGLAIFSARAEAAITLTSPSPGTRVSESV